MTPTEIKAARCGLSQTEFAEILGVRQSRISEWESGVRPVPEYIVRLIRCLRKSGELQ